jgi:hypothetical protein
MNAQDLKDKIISILEANKYDFTVEEDDGDVEIEIEGKTGIFIRDDRAQFTGGEFNLNRRTLDELSFVI